jgi:ATP-binding cassette subfamily C protein LapB
MNTPDMRTSQKPVEKLSPSMQMAWAINSCIRLQGKDIDRLLLHSAITGNTEKIDELALSANNNDESIILAQNWQSLLKKVGSQAGIEVIEEYDQPDPARMPAISWLEEHGWVVIRGKNPQNSWLVDVAGTFIVIAETADLPCIRLVKNLLNDGNKTASAYQIFKNEFLQQKKTMVEAGVASLLTNLLALGTSLYSMQVYDRVIPTQGYATLFALTLGIFITLVFDLIIKVARSYLMEHAITEMDRNLSRSIFSRFLNVRLDQLPTTVGSLSSQLRGFETIRSFLSTKTFYIFIDAPFGIFFVLMIALIGSPIAALVPLFFLVISLAFGFVMKDRIDSHALKSTDASNRKTGLLVEAIEGAETIKSGAGSWGILSKWIDTSEVAMEHDMALRSITEKTSYVSALLQQISYVGLICVGAYIAAEGHMTMGSLIACSILSGRAMAPVAQIPGLMVQAAHAKAALNQLEKVFSLEGDNHDVDRPLIPDTIKGNYQLERVHFAYPGSPRALIINKLTIKSGEKIGVVGPIGAGKSTLLRLLTGMYQPSEGLVLLDGLDINHISRHFLGEQIGYLQQDHRLFSGTLRENILVGIPDPGDEKIKEIATQTGLITAISNHPKGLDLIIAEGGKGLSGGQKQLVALTRLLISNPSIWLLDEPTASIDNATEIRCMSALKNAIKPSDTLILVTHKLSSLSMVDRIICISDHQIIMDGPRDEVLKKLTTPNQT